MSYGIESKKLKKLVNFYSPFNNGQEITFLNLFKGDEGLLRYLETSPFQGIDENSLEERRIWFGSNNPPECRVQQNLRDVFLSPFEYFGMKLNLIFSILALILGLVGDYDSMKYSWIGGLASICLFLFAYILLTIPEICQYYENLQLKKYAFDGCKVTVWRDNQKKEVQSFDLVVGDIVELEKGHTVGADGLLIEGSISVKESLGYKELTVEKKTTKQCSRIWADNEDKIMNLKFSLNKSNKELELPSPIVLGGSKVISGEGRLVVLCVGKFSRAGYFVYQVHNSANERKSILEKKIDSVVFEVSKYLVLSLIVFIVLYFIKIVVFIIVQKITNQSWSKIWLDFAKGITVILTGMPIAQVIGFAVSSFYLKIKIFRTDNILYKYSKDCGTMREITSIVFDKSDEKLSLKLTSWWNEEEEPISENNTQFNRRFEELFVESIKSKNFNPSEVGFKFQSFFSDMSLTTLEYLETLLSEFAEKRDSEKRQSFPSVIQIEESEESFNESGFKEYELVYFKGSAHTLLRYCTHMMNKKTGVIKTITPETRAMISEQMWKFTSQEITSVITGYVEVNPKKMRVMDSTSSIVLLSVVGFKEMQDIVEMDSLERLKNVGVTFTLIGQSDHDETVAMAKDIGIIVQDKPSIRLRGFDFNRIVEGIICKSCKKEMCICSTNEKRLECLKNQDEFNRIYKHLNVLSETSPSEKLCLAVGFSYAQEKTFFLGKDINDVPAMRASTLSAVVRSNTKDEMVNFGAEVFIPNNNLTTMEKMMNWSVFFNNFSRKFTTLILVPCIVAFISSCISFILYNSFCISLFQFAWISAVILPLLGLSLALMKPTGQNIIEENKKKDEPLLDKICYRQIIFQVIFQVIIIVVTLIFGNRFIPEDSDDIDSIIGTDWAAKYNSASMKTVCTGISDDIFNFRTEMYIKTFEEYGIYSRHFTFIYNLFVLMQFLNYFNCFNIGEKSIFKAVSIQSIIGFIAAFTLHVLTVFVGGTIFELYPNGLTPKQWGISLSLSLFVLIIGIVLKQIPYESEDGESNAKIWQNRCYNLAVMATAQRETLQDFEIDEEMEVRQMNKRANEN